MKINILGTDYEIKYKAKGEDKELGEELDGYCNSYSHEIVLWDMESCDEPQEIKTAKIKESLRHEIIHAFLNESGLKWNCLQGPESWVKNEEMIDWFAIQFSKILKIYQEVNAI